jgi:hypothetical protein
LGTLVRSKSFSSDPEDEEDDEPELEVTFFSAQEKFHMLPENMLGCILPDANCSVDCFFFEAFALGVTDW